METTIRGGEEKRRNSLKAKGTSTKQLQGPYRKKGKGMVLPRALGLLMKQGFWKDEKGIRVPGRDRKDEVGLDDDDNEDGAVGMGASTEFKPIKLPLEPLNEDSPAKWPLPSSALHGRKMVASRQCYSSQEAGDSSRALVEHRSKHRADRIPELIVPPNLTLHKVRGVFKKFVQPRYVDFPSLEDMFEGLEPSFLHRVGFPF
ncbi:hypothetical protein Taro_048606 [Colocasia esculenta]|uniref:Uncharacterized protein n=1 Tax=Colocasia esculenta TaxID=4460 RepID=A0A843X8K0_COLES|nr:hypothetical protein [Colocasia esculenta]